MLVAFRMGAISSKTSLMKVTRFLSSLSVAVQYDSRRLVVLLSLNCTVRSTRLLILVLSEMARMERYRRR